MEHKLDEDIAGLQGETSVESPGKKAIRKKTTAGKKAARKKTTAGKNEEKSCQEWYAH
jgi:hypothetical protein